MTTADLIAETLRQLGIHYNNTIKDYAKALQVTEDAFQLVASEGLQVRLRQDMRIYQWNIAQAAFEAAAEASDYEQALAIYEDLEQYADPAEGQEALDPFRGALEDLRVVHEGKPIQPFLPFLHAPSPPHSAAQESERRWTPSLTPTTGIVILLAVVTIGLALPRFFVSQTSTPSSTAPPPPSQPTRAPNSTTPLKGDETPRKEGTVPQELSKREPQRPTPPKVKSSAPGGALQTITPAQPSLNRSALRTEIERRRSALDAEDAALEAEQAAISRDRAALEDLHANIEARYEGYPDGLPPGVYARYEVEITEHEQRVRRFNARVQAYNARVAASKRAVAEFNALVNQYNASR